ILTLSGLVFFAWGEPIFVLLLMFTICLDYACGLGISKYKENKKMKRLFLLLSVIINLSLLAVFKYSDMFVGTINSIIGTNIPLPNIPLPIGISFYTFQSMSYTIDMYRDNIKVQKNLISYATYVSLFPQIVAGPIVRYEDVQNEIDTRKINIDLISQGIGIFLKGLAKKMLIANNIGALWSIIKIQNLNEMPALTAWLGILAFTFQIYYDFSGYSDMAVGLGKMLGFNFPENFNFPYMAKSISEFWRRWHITLGSWFKSYVYFPLGGNRKGKYQTIINLAIVWGVTGLWHGASWNFLFWGLYFGFIIIAEKLFLNKWLEKIPSFARITYSFLLVVFGWVMFEMSTLENIFGYFKAMFFANGAGLYNNDTIYYILSYGIIFIIAIFFSSNYYSKKYEILKEKYPKTFGVIIPIVQVATFIICTAYLVDSTYNPFLYFRF
ncbi:MAG: MBOAT family O-acyltransferase, partial [Clostridia bacterium]